MVIRNLYQFKMRSTRRGSKYGALDESDVHSFVELDRPTESDPQPGITERYGCFSYLRTFLMYIFTDWPWETVKNISMPCNKPAPNPNSSTIQEERKNDEAAMQGQSTNKEKRSCSTDKLILWFFIVLLRLLFLMTGLVAQVMTCFRRDWISTDLTTIESTTMNTTTQILKCSERDEVISGLLIPDMVIFLLAFWVYFALKFANQVCRGCFGWRELSVVIKADTANKLKELVQEINPKQLGKSITSGYISISISYILLSQGVSVLYLYAFQLADEDVVIQSPLQDRERLSGGLKSGMIALSFVGFITLDLLYIRVIMKYAFRCQMIIYYLQMIKNNINDFQNAEERTKRKQQRSVRENEAEEITDDNIMSCEDKKAEEVMQENENDKKAEEVMQENENAYTFIKYLNASSSTVGFIILIASFQAANCAVFLLGNNITYFQASAVALRLILWGFLAVFPFHKAAGVNIAFKRLRDLGWDIRAPLLGGPYGSNNSRQHINLKARVFGISVNPWLPYMVVIVLLLTIIVGAKFKWYEHVL